MHPSHRLEALLLRIPAQHVEQLRIILQWLAFGNEPVLQSRSQIDQHLLTLDQLAEVSIVSLDSLTADIDRFIRSAELREILGDMVEPEVVPRKRWINDEQPVTTIRLKDEVKEELLSGSFRQGAASRFGFDEGQAKEIIAVTCLILLTTPDDPNEKSEWFDTADKYPLAYFAALFWIDFIDTEIHSSILCGLIRKIFLNNPGNLEKWTKLLVQAGDAYLNSNHSGLISAISDHSDTKTGEHAPAMVWAAAFNLKFIVKDLLTQGDNINAAGGGRAVSALYMAVHEKHLAMTSLLLDAGGDVADQYHEPTGEYEYGWAVSPLYLACHKGYSREWIDLLLQDRTKLGRPGWRLEVAMESAARFGHLHCLKALIDAGADANKGTGHEESYGCPLQAACDRGNEEVVCFLLQNDANPNTTGGNIWLGNVHTPLHMAAYRGDVSVVKLLLEHGADPNIQGGALGNALIAAIWNAHHSPSGDGNLALVKLLLQHGSSPEEEWNMTGKLQDLNFSYSSDEKRSLEERFDSPLAEWIKSDTFDEDDLSPGSEAALRQRIDEKWNRIHEGRRQKQSRYMCGCMNRKGKWLFPKASAYLNKITCYQLRSLDTNHHPLSAFESRHKIRTKIRKAAALISMRLHEAGICPAADSCYSLNAIQTAIVMERPNLVSLLQDYGAEMPAVMVPGASQSVEEAESIARILRQRRSFNYSTRTAAGRVWSSGGTILP